MHIEIGKYRHYKGNEYEVVGVAKHSEDESELVVYRPMYESAVCGYALCPCLLNLLWLMVNLCRGLNS